MQWFIMSRALNCVCSGVRQLDGVGIACHEAAGLWTRRQGACQGPAA